MSASETHNLANLRMTREQSFSELAEGDRAGETRVAGQRVLSCCFGCPMEGEVEPEAVLELITRFAALEVDGVTLCDTTGMAYPTQVGATSSASWTAARNSS